MPDHHPVASRAQTEAVGPEDGSDPGTPGSFLRRCWNVVAKLLASRPLRWGFVVVTVAIAVYAVFREWHAVRDALTSMGTGRLVLALICVVLAAIATMQAWRALLAALGSPLPARGSARVLFLGQLGKYLPGSVWPVLAQMELASDYKVPRVRSATASVLTMVLAVLTGMLTALATLPLVARSTGWVWVFLAVPVLLVCLHPKLLNRFLNLLLKLIRRPALEHQLSGQGLAVALGWSMLSWICFGLQIWLMVTRLGASYGTGALLALGSFAFAWCVGFIAVFAPAGAGARDVLLVVLLTPTIGLGAAAAVALVSRVLTTLCDLVCAAAAVGYSRLTPGARHPAGQRHGFGPEA